jgi:hypothetical protein
MGERATSWAQTGLTALLIPLLLALFSSYCLPRIVEKSNRRQLSRTERLKKAFDFGERNKEMNSRLNALKTRMHIFNQQNVRGRFSPVQVREAQKLFEQQHTSDYLDLDKNAWWWYWDLEREAQVFDLLSAQELNVLHDLLLKYGNNMSQSVGSISPAWEYLSSADYKSDKGGQKRFADLYAAMIAKLDALANERSELIKSISKLFAQTQHVPFESGNQ